MKSNQRNDLDQTGKLENGWALLDAMTSLRASKPVLCSTPGCNHSTKPNFSQILNQTVNQKSGQQNELQDIEEFAQTLQNLFAYEYSISQPELGSLFALPSGNAENLPLQASMEWIAEQHGVSVAFPATSGTTALNNIMLTTLASPGDTILIQRDSHISLLSSAIHIGLDVKYIMPCYSESLKISLGVTPVDLDKMLTRHPEIRVVVLTYPNYFGIASDIVGCGEVVQRHGKILAIDGAHGAHFSCHLDLPTAAEKSGAAMVTQSNHKVCATLSQASLILLQENENIPYLVNRFYEVVNQCGFITTSFSYPILASLILSEIYLATQGKTDLDNAIAATNKLRQDINEKLYPLHCFGLESQQSGFYEFDPLRITVNVEQLGRTGFDVAHELIDQYRIYPEMETLQHVLFLFNPHDDEQRTSMIYQALHEIVEKNVGAPLITSPPNLQELPTPVMSLRDVFYTPPTHKIFMPIYEAVGHTSAETIAAYPPGAAIIVGGEQITLDAVEFLQKILLAGGVLKGASDPEFTVINTVVC